MDLSKEIVDFEDDSEQEVSKEEFSVENIPTIEEILGETLRTMEKSENFIVLETVVLKPFFTAVSPFLKSGVDLYSSNLVFTVKDKELTLMFFSQGVRLKYKVPLREERGSIPEVFVLGAKAFKSFSFQTSLLTVSFFDGYAELLGVGSLQLDFVELDLECYQVEYEGKGVKVESIFFNFLLKDLFKLMNLAYASEQELFQFTKKEVYGNFLSSVVRVTLQKEIDLPICLNKLLISVIQPLLPSSTEFEIFYPLDSLIVFKSSSYELVFPLFASDFDNASVKELFDKFESFVSVLVDPKRIGSFSRVFSSLQSQSVEFVFGEDFSIRAVTPVSRRYDVSFPLEQVMLESKTYLYSADLFVKMANVVSGFEDLELHFSERGVMFSSKNVKIYTPFAG